MKKLNTDWSKVRAAAKAGTPVPYDPETDLYDPNDEASVHAFWKGAKKSRPGRPPVAVSRPTLNMRVDADILECLRASGKGWQTRVNSLLREAVERGKI